MSKSWSDFGTVLRRAAAQLPVDRDDLTKQIARLEAAIRDAETELASRATPVREAWAAYQRHVERRRGQEGDRPKDAATTMVAILDSGELREASERVQSTASSWQAVVDHLRQLRKHRAVLLDRLDLATPAEELQAMLEGARDELVSSEADIEASAAECLEAFDELGVIEARVARRQRLSGELGMALGDPDPVLVEAQQRVDAASRRMAHAKDRRQSARSRIEQLSFRLSDIARKRAQEAEEAAAFEALLAGVPR